MLKNIRYILLLTCLTTQVSFAGDYMGYFNYSPNLEPRTIGLAGATLADISMVSACTNNTPSILLQPSTIGLCVVNAKQPLHKNVLEGTSTENNSAFLAGVIIKFSDAVAISLAYNEDAFSNIDYPIKAISYEYKYTDDSIKPSVSARIFDELVVGMTPIFYWGESEGIENSGKRATVSSQTWSGTAFKLFAQYQISSSLSLATAYNSEANFKDNLNRKESTLLKIGKPYKPAKVELASAWSLYKGSSSEAYPMDTTFYSGLDLVHYPSLRKSEDKLYSPASVVLGPTSEMREILPTLKIIPKLSFETRILKTKFMEFTPRFGTYFSPALLWGERGNLHTTTGITLGIWMLYLDAGFDFSAETYQQVYGVRFALSI